MRQKILAYALVLIAIIVAVVGFLYSQKGSQEFPVVGKSDRYEWTMSTVWKDNLNILSNNMDEFTRILDSSTNYRLHVKILKGELPSKTSPLLGDYLSAVKGGEIQLLHSCSYYWRDIPGSIYFTAIPFGKNAPEMKRWLDNGGSILWKRAYAKFGIEPFACGNTGYQPAGWYESELKEVANFKNLKIRFVGVGNLVLKSLGADPKEYTPSKMMEEIAAGRLNAGEFTGYYDDYQLGLHKLGWHLYSGWQEPSTTFEIIVNKKAMDSLPKDLQEALRSTISIINNRISSEYLSMNDVFRIKLINEEKIREESLDTSITSILRLKTKEVLKAYKIKYLNESIVEEIDRSYNWGNE